MREFKCYDCGHTWKLPFGQGGRGVDLLCPECESDNIHRAGGEKGRGRGGRGRGYRHGGVEDLGGAEGE